MCRNVVANGDNVKYLRQRENERRQRENEWRQRENEWRQRENEWRNVKIMATT